jgi:hypothetical protein
VAANEPEAAPEPIPEVAYDGGSDAVFTTESQMEVPDAGPISGEAGTISFVVKPYWDGGSQDDATFVQLGDSGLQIVKNVNYLRFEYIDETGAERGLGTSIGNWKPGEWREVTTTWSGGTLALYVDGKLISQERFPNPPQFQPDTRLYVGSSPPGGAASAFGEISQLRVLNRSSSPDEVSRRFQSSPRRIN